MPSKPILNRLHECFATVTAPVHLRRTGLVTLIVGTWLTAFNQGNVLLAGDLDTSLVIKIALNYLTPFVVANLGLLSHRPR